VRSCAMSSPDDMKGTPVPDDMRRVVSCSLRFVVTEPAEIALQVVAADSAGHVVTERFDVTANGGPPSSLDQIRTPHGERIHVITAGPGQLSIEYRAEVEARSTQREAGQFVAPGGGVGGGGPAPDYERQLYLRPSRYCPSDHLVGFAVSEFYLDADPVARVASITEWIRNRISYVPGSSDVHDSAEHTLLTGMGTCRDFAHLGIALCRATGIPARFAAVYAPGLTPMDFHAVFETWQLDRWSVHDATGLAPRTSLVRIATGRDAADAAFATVDSGVVDMEYMEVTATVGTELPRDNQSDIVELP
jgi:transglutaminase-like putative cysteine protease